MWSVVETWKSVFEADLDGHSRIPFCRTCCPQRPGDQLMVGVCPPQAAPRLPSTAVSQTSKDFPREFALDPSTERKMHEPEERGDTEAGVKAQLSSCIHPVGPTDVSSCLHIPRLLPRTWLFICPSSLCALCSPGLSPLSPSL